LLGTFAGLLPCADCAAIRTELRLYAEPRSGDATRYELTETYLKTREGDRSIERSGRWTMTRGSASDPDATVYQLDSGRADARRNFVRAGDDELRLLDRERRELSTSARHVLYRTITLSEDDAGRVIDLDRGQHILVRLRSDRTTGYRWTIASLALDKLTKLGDTMYVRDTAARGGGGAETWSFLASRTGDQELRFEYRRLFELDSPVAKSVTYTIRVR
jgi:copper homeostasis protein (lipoprotein)